MNKQSKQVTWDSNVQNNQPTKKIKIEDTLSKLSLELIEKLSFYFKYGLDLIIIAELKTLSSKDPNELKKFMKATHYQIFDWALMNNKPKLMRYLLSKIPRKRISWLLAHNDYAAVKYFFNQESYQHKNSEMVKLLTFIPSETDIQEFMSSNPKKHHPLNNNQSDSSSTTFFQPKTTVTKEDTSTTGNLAAVTHQSHY